MPNIGSRKMAKAALAVSDGDSPANEFGLSYGGTNNCSREVLFDVKNKVVYKVEPDWIEEDYTYNNKRELDNARALWRKYPDGKVGKFVRIPRTSGYNIDGRLVIAMEMIEGALGFDWQPNCIWGKDRKGKPRLWKKSEPARKELLKLNFGDMHGGNFIIDKEGQIWPIDMGSPMYKGAADRRLLG